MKDHNIAVLDIEQNIDHERGPNPRNLLSEERMRDNVWLSTGREQRTK